MSINTHLGKGIRMAYSQHCFSLSKLTCLQNKVDEMILRLLVICLCIFYVEAFLGKASRLKPSKRDTRRLETPKEQHLWRFCAKDFLVREAIHFIYVVVFNTEFRILLVDEFAHYLRYARRLEFFDSPDYDYCFNLFKSVMDKMGWQDDLEFDWSSRLNQVTNMLFQ